MGADRGLLPSAAACRLQVDNSDKSLVAAQRYGPGARASILHRRLQARDCALLHGAGRLPMVMYMYARTVRGALAIRVRGCIASLRDTVALRSSPAVYRFKSYTAARPPQRIE